MHQVAEICDMPLCRFSDLITIFDIRNEENLDKKILSALLKGDDLRLQSQVRKLSLQGKNLNYPDVPCHGLEQG